MQTTIPHKPRLLCFILYILTSNSIVSSSPTENHRTYIIHMDVSAKPASFSSHDKWYKSIIASLPTTKCSTPPTHLYTYSHVFHGFSAVVSPSQLQRLEQMPGHLSAQPDSYGKHHTTHTPKFLGLTPFSGLWPASTFGNGTIIGIIDSGIWPESASFSDKGMPAVPKRWKGKCESGTEFNASLCNRKLIGARSFSKGLKQQGLNVSRSFDYNSSRDFLGHGTHTSSTAAGNQVSGASYFGYAKGNATGIAPMARVAMYKAVFFTDTFESAATDVLAAMDQAIADGVDLMSLSLGFEETPYYENVIAIGSFAAMEKGIFVSVSAGNSGPQRYTMVNSAPWFTSVGAGTIDRDYIATFTLGSSKKMIQGRSIFPENILIRNASLYFGHGDINKETCSFNSLNPKEVANKVVFCSASNKSNIYTQIAEVYRSGAQGAIFETGLGQFLTPEDFYMPCVTVSSQHGRTIKKYVTQATAPTVGIRFVSTRIGLKPSPQVAGFSSRGPSTVSPGILKPDLLAPGVNILAAWVPNQGFAPVGEDYLQTDYALLSGTSMASPHVIGVAAMLKSVHRKWSPASIRSAMMTTADVTDNTGGPITDMTTGTAATPLEFGAGHVNPNKAMDPGLVYDIELDDYMDFLCGLNYTSIQIGIISRRHEYKCRKANLDLNYPSFTIALNAKSSKHVFKRVLTNVGVHPAEYLAEVKAPKGMRVTVKPQLLSFTKKHSKGEFLMEVDVNLEDGIATERDTIWNYGFLRWREVGGVHVVTSPIVSVFAP